MVGIQVLASVVYGIADHTFTISVTALPMDSHETQVPMSRLFS